jgi:hypothetical protein
MTFFIHLDNRKALVWVMGQSPRECLTFQAFLAACLALLISCTSLQGKDQSLKVVTDPPGAAIYLSGTKLGTTPTFIQLSRKRHESLVLKYPDMPDVTVDLVSRYRWGDSFAGNFLWGWFWPLIPVGWGLDYYTESAWSFENLHRIQLGVVNSSSDKHFSTPLKRVAIAPPKGVGTLLADEIARELESALLARHKDVLVEPYFQTLNTFRHGGYEDENLNAEASENLYAEIYSSSRSEIKPTHVLESIANESSQAYEMDVTLVDIYTGERTTWNAVVLKSNLRVVDESFYKRLLKESALIVPNSLGLSLSKSVSSVRDDVNGYYSEEYFDGNAFSYLSNISIKNIKPSQARARWKFHFDFTSSLDLGYRRIRFRNDVVNRIETKRYDWYSVLFGLGPRVGLQTFGGVFYAEVEPSIGGSWIRWDGERQDSRGLIGFQAELGYLYFFSKQVNLRLFVNSTSVSTEQWDAVLRDSGAGNIRTSAAGYTRAGVSLGYFFPEIQSYARQWVAPKSEDHVRAPNRLFQ